MSYTSLLSFLWPEISFPIDGLLRLKLHLVSFFEIVLRDNNFVRVVSLIVTVCFQNR